MSLLALILQKAKNNLSIENIYILQDADACNLIIF